MDNGKTLRRIAAALERIADALESQQTDSDDYEPDTEPESGALSSARGSITPVAAPIQS